MNLEALAPTAMREACRGCTNRSPSRFLGGTIASQADAKRAAQQARDERAHADAEALRRHSDCMGLPISRTLSGVGPVIY
jgi:DNA-binding IclR family transcriptional regulator